MQKAITNKSGKPTTVENIDKRDAARQKPSANPVIVASNSPYDSAVAARRPADKLDREQEMNRLAQAKTEQSRVSENPQDAKEYNVRREG